jgi:hypothetical protein
VVSMTVVESSNSPISLVRVPCMVDVQNTSTSGSGVPSMSVILPVRVWADRDVIALSTHIKKEKRGRFFIFGLNIGHARAFQSLRCANIQRSRPACFVTPTANFELLFMSGCKALMFG